MTLSETREDGAENSARISTGRQNALVLCSAAIIAFSVTVLEHSTVPRVLSAAIGLCFCAPLLLMLWTELRRPSPAKLVKVVRASSPADWMEVRFGNPDYARLVDELNPDRQENRKPTIRGVKLCFWFLSRSRCQTLFLVFVRGVKLCFWFLLNLRLGRVPLGMCQDDRESSLRVPSTT